MNELDISSLSIEQLEAALERKRAEKDDLLRMKSELEEYCINQFGIPLAKIMAGDSERRDPSRILDRPINVLELTTRVRNAFDSLNISNLRQLVSASETDLLEHKNLGKRSLDVVKSELAKHGLHLGMHVHANSGMGASG